MEVQHLDCVDDFLRYLIHQNPIKYVNLLYKIYVKKRNEVNLEQIIKSNILAYYD